MAHDHRGRPVGRPWMHDVEGMRAKARKGDRKGVMADTGEEGYLDPEDLAGFHYVNPRSDD